MSFTNETSHYGIPLPLGSDLTTPMDYNEAMRKIDTNLFQAVTDSTQASQKASDVEENLAQTDERALLLTGRVTTLEGTVVTQGGAIQQNSTRIEEVEDDALDMVCAVDEGTAQVATVAVEEGKYFRYNNVLYMATTNIAIGDTIVPNTNCRATNVATELENITPSGEVIDVTARQGVATNASHIGDLTGLETTNKSNLVSAVNEVVAGLTKNASSDVTVQYATEQTRNIGSLATIFPSLTGLTISKIKSLICVNTTDSTPVVGMLDNSGNIWTKSFVDLTGSKVVKVTITYVE